MHARKFAPGFLVVAVLGVLGCTGSSGVRAETSRTFGARRAPDGTVVLDRHAASFVEVATVHVVSELPVARAPGRVVFREGAVAEIGTTFDGRIEQIHVTVGAHVHRGDPLVTLESPDAVSTRALGRSAEVVLRAARTELERVRAMRAEGSASDREVVEAERLAADADVQAVRARATSALLGGGGGDRLVLRSPIDGMVLDVSAVIGRVAVEGSEALVRVGDPSALWVEAEVFEHDVALLSVGGSAQIHFGDEAPATGRIEAISAAISGASRTARVRITLDSIPANIRPGAYVRVDLDAPRSGVVLPATAILIRSGREYAVYVERPGEALRFERHIVTVGPSIDGQVSVLDGIAPNARVVVRGALLIDGSSDQLL